MLAPLSLLVCHFSLIITDTNSGFSRFLGNINCHSDYVLNLNVKPIVFNLKELFSNSLFGFRKMEE